MASLTQSSRETSLCGSPQLLSSGDQAPSDISGTDCSICQEAYTLPKVLSCLHTFCQKCHEKIQESSEIIQCPRCMQGCPLPPQGISGLVPDYAVINLLSYSSQGNFSVSCTSCKHSTNHAIARCFDCSDNLCSNCVMAHRNMHCFVNHRVENLKERSHKDNFKTDKPICCPQHKDETLIFFCRTCNIPICKECIDFDHPEGQHDYDYMAEVGSEEVEMLGELLEQSKTKTNDLRNTVNSVGHFSSLLEMQYNKAQTEVRDTFHFYGSVLHKRKNELMNELEDLYNTNMISLSLLGNEFLERVDTFQQMSIFADRMMKFSSKSEILMFKQLLDAQLQTMISYNPEVSIQTVDPEFLSDYPAINIGVKNTFGYIRHNSTDSPTFKPQPIASTNGVISSDCTSQSVSASESSIILNRFTPDSRLGTFSTNGNPCCGPKDIFQNRPCDSFHPHAESVIDLTSKFIPTSFYPPHTIRQNISYQYKFGGFGTKVGQFSEPSGIAVNAQNNIIVADTYNHRIQIFDKEGRFRFRFGERGTGDGELLYPVRVSVVKTSGDLVVVERSPTNQIQIYNQYGMFIRKFGANILQNPRGVAVDNKGHIIVVEFKVMILTIFDQVGNVLQRFDCSMHLEYPNGVVVNDKQEIFISDLKAHCVKVFNYEGFFLRLIGCHGLTNYPSGLCISQDGEILVANNHNGLKLTIFDENGLFLNGLQSQAKHAQLFDVAHMDDGAVVVSTKDCCLYIYRYI